MMKQHGFTLIELMVTLSIAAILLTVGIPSFNNTIKNNQLTGTVNQFIADINLARNTAIKYQRTAKICILVPNTTTPDQPSCATAGTDWSAGWLVWVDKNKDGSIDNNERIRIMDSFPGTISFDSTSRFIFDFNARGFMANGSTDQIDMCDNRTGETGRRIQVSTTGRVKTTNLSCS